MLKPSLLVDVWGDVESAWMFFVQSPFRSVFCTLFERKPHHFNTCQRDCIYLAITNTRIKVKQAGDNVNGVD